MLDFLVILSVEVQSQLSKAKHQKHLIWCRYVLIAVNDSIGSWWYSNLLLCVLNITQTLAEDLAKEQKDGDIDNFLGKVGFLIIIYELEWLVNDHA